MTVTKDIMITAEEYYGYSDGPPYHQLVAGQLIMSPSPSAYHQRILKRLILSPANAHLDRTSKRKLYAQSGVRELWLVDPESKSIDLYELLNKPAIPLKTFQKSEILTSPLLPGLTLQLEKIFSHIRRHRSVFIMSRLIGPSHRHSDIVGLIRSQFGKLDPDFLQMKPCHLLIEVFGQYVNAR